jgi:hypothetical protein
MDNILIPLNDERLPIPNCITIEMMEVLLTNPRFEEFYYNIKEHPGYKNFTKKTKKQQKKVLDPLMASNLSEYLDKEATRNNKRSKKNSMSIRSSTFTPRTIKTGLNTTNINSLAPYTSYTPFSTLVSARGGALGTVIDFARALAGILFVLYLFNPNLFMNRLISSSLRELLNVSTDKNSERLVYLLVTRVDNYFVKIAPCKNNLTKKYVNDNIDINNLDTRTNKLITDYIYECMFYEEMKKPTGAVYEGKDLSEYVSEITDWNINKVSTGRERFNVIINGRKFNLNNTRTSYGKPPVNMSLSESIFDNFSDEQTNSYSYSIVKNYKDFMTYKAAIHDRSFNNILKIYQNGCTLLRLFNTIKGYCHWDLHYHNLLVNPRTGEVKFFDFDLSDVHNSVSNIHERLPFLLDEDNKRTICYKPILGHLYDYYRFIIETIDNEQNLRRELIKQIREKGITCDDVNDIVDYFTSEGYLIRKAEPNYTPEELRNIELLKDQLNSMYSNYPDYLKNLNYYFTKLLETIDFFNNVE